MQDYGTVALRKIQPIAPIRRILTPDAGPRITLPGPALPPPFAFPDECGNLRRDWESKPRASRKSTGNWMVSSLTAVLMSATVLGVILFALPHFGSEPKSAPAMRNNFHCTSFSCSPAAHARKNRHVVRREAHAIRRPIVDVIFPPNAPELAAKSPMGAEIVTGNELAGGAWSDRSANDLSHVPYNPAARIGSYRNWERAPCRMVVSARA